MNSILFLIFFSGNAYLSQRNFAEASRYYRLASAISPSYESCYGVAVCALADGELNKSVKLFERISSMKPEISYYLGIVYYQLGMLDRSTAYFNNLFGKNGDIWQHYYYLGLIKLKEYEIEKAIAYFNQTPDVFNKVWLVEYIKNYNQLMSAYQEFRSGRYNEALDLYETVEHFTEYRAIGLALAYAQIKEYDKALSLLDSVINKSDDRGLVARSLFEAGKVYFNTENTLKARDYLRKQLDIEPNDETQFLIGRTFSSEAKYDSAVLYFKNLPDSVDRYLFHKGRTDYFLGLWGKAEESLLRHREIFSGSIYGDRAIFILASINFRRKEYNYAIDFWSDLVTIYPQSVYAAAAQKGIGDTYFNIKEYKNALDAYRMVKKFEPSTSIKAQTTLMIYETLYHLRKYPSLIEALRRFIEENPMSRLILGTRMRIAKLLTEKKEYYRSLAELNKIIESYPDSTSTNRVFIEKARIYQMIGNPREVKNVFHQLLARNDADEYHSYAADQLGAIYFDAARYDSALHYYNLLLSDKKYREKATFEIAKIYDILGQNKESETMINKLISEFPSSVFLFDAYILKAKAYKNQSYYEEAINILKELIKKVGQKPEIYIEIGNVYFEIEDYLNARKNYLVACQHFKQRRDDAAKALLLAGDASIALSDIKGAGEHYLQAHLIAESITLKNQASAKISAISDE